MFTPDPILQDSDLLLATVHDFFSATVAQWQEAKYQDVELAVTLLYSLAEALPVSVLCGTRLCSLAETLPVSVLCGTRLCSLAETLPVSVLCGTRLKNLIVMSNFTFSSQSRGQIEMCS